MRNLLTIDLLFTNINLGKGINGIELALYGASSGFLPSLKILVTTGDTLKNVLPRALGTILAKPCAVSDLLGRVKHALAA